MARCGDALCEKCGVVPGDLPDTGFGYPDQGNMTHPIAAPLQPIRKDGGTIANALRAIARANAAAMMRAHEVRWGADGAGFPNR